MRESDVICKKTLKHLGVTYFIKNKIYKIDFSDVPFGTSTVLSELGSRVGFNLSIDSVDEYKYQDYFSTIKEERKQKLKKINENSR